MKHLHFLFALVLFLACAHAAAQPAQVPGALAPAIAQAQKALQNDSSLDESHRESLLKRLEQASQDDTQADALLQQAREFSAAAESLSGQISTLEAELLHDPSEQFTRWRAELDPAADPAVLLQQAADLKAAASHLSSRIADTGAQLAAVDLRPGTIAQELDQTRRQIDALNLPRTPAANLGLPQQIDGLAAQASQRLHLAQIQALSAERSTLPLRARLLELTQRSLQRQATLVQRQTGVIDALLERNTDAELDALGARLRDVADGSGEQSPLLAAEARRNVALGQELLSTEAATRQANEQLRQTRMRGEESADTLRNTQARLALQSHDDAVGLILLNERRRADDPRHLQQHLLQTRRQLAQVQLHLIDLDEQADLLASHTSSLDTDADADTPTAASDPATREALHALFNTRAELLSRLISAERERLRVLTELESALAQHLDTTTTLTRLLDRELLWFPSHERINLPWLKHQGAGWYSLLAPAHYREAAGHLLNSFKYNWPLFLAAIALLGLLLRQHQRLPLRLNTFAQPLLRVRSDRYRYTLRALLATAFAALLPPLLPALIGWLLHHSAPAGSFSAALGLGLLSIAGSLFLFQGLHLLIIDNGVAQKHFRWTQARRDAVSAALPWLFYLILPTQLLLALAFIQGEETVVDTAGRLLLVALCSIGALLCWRLLAPGALWTFRGIADPEPSTPRRALRVGLVAGFLAIILLALGGYVLTASMLLHSLWLSLLLVTTLTIFHGLIARWFLLGERRLTLRRIEAKREAESEHSAPPDSGSPDETPPIDPESEALSIQSVSLQTRRLLRAMITAMMVLGLLWVWSGVLPALDRLDTITLWTLSATDAQGNPIAITLSAALAGLLTLVLTFIAARNLPGLVELSLLSRIHIDAGTRYAITSISRYLIIVIGLMIGLGLLGVRWSQLQWLAAAFTVGLGFGLQEIFANFVSGIIVLFERPYRVGDTITIAEVEGRVTRIRTRATTVLDADNREVVVPNKTFITSRFINWTLSDTVTRLVFKLGLTQDADPQTVRSILLDVARSHPLVLEQPAPACWFTQIASNTYDFELRLFVAELGHRTRVRDELNRRIAQALNQANLATNRPNLLRVEMQDY